MFKNNRSQLVQKICLNKKVFSFESYFYFAWQRKYFMLKLLHNKNVDKFCFLFSEKIFGDFLTIKQDNYACFVLFDCNKKHLFYLQSIQNNKTSNKSLV